MILDKIENAKMYKVLGERIAKGLEYIETTDMKALEPGTYVIADGVRALISEYNSKNIEDAKPEAHEKYLDIQYIISGVEQIGYAPLEGQTPSIPYNTEKDLVFYDVPTSLSKVMEGMFAIYFPTDIHQPGVKLNDSAPVKKAVIKVLV